LRGSTRQTSLTSRNSTTGLIVTGGPAWKPYARSAKTSLRWSSTAWGGSRLPLERAVPGGSLCGLSLPLAARGGDEPGARRPAALGGGDFTHQSAHERDRGWTAIAHNRKAAAVSITKTLDGCESGHLKEQRGRAPADAGVPLDSTGGRTACPTDARYTSL